MNFQIGEDASGVYVRISGDLDFAANTEFKAIVTKLAGMKGRPVTLDLAGVNRIDSVGLGLLYIVKEEVGAYGNKIRLKSPQKSVMKMLELTEAGTDFDIQP